MKKIHVILAVIGAAVLGIAAQAQAGDLWRVKAGAYASSNWDALKRLYNMEHHSREYRDYRDYLMTQGILFPVSGVVEVVKYLRDAAVLEDRNGNIIYLPEEDFAYQVSGA